jgi:hypothetical protein
LPGPTDEWLATPILFGARRFADDQPVCLRIADAKHGICPALRQFTARAISHAFTQVVPAETFHRNSGLLNEARFITVSGQPDIDAHCLQVGTTLVFGVDHDRDRKAR